MNFNDMFLQEYRSVETTLRNKFGLTYLAFEESNLPADFKPKMQVCRIMRNYLTHEKDGAQFLCASPMQITFLHSLNETLQNTRR